MRAKVTLGVDVGTSSTKGVLVRPDGSIVRSAQRKHTVERPSPGHVEMDGRVWWQEFIDIARELLTPDDVDVAAVGVSGMGPCVLLTDEHDEPVRPAILYGVDSRSTEQIIRLRDEFGGDQSILERCGSVLTTQAVGPKLAWVAEHEPERFAAARRLFMPASWLGYRLTGTYALDFHSASQCTPMFDDDALDWFDPWADHLRGPVSLPPLRWAGDLLGTVTASAAKLTAIPQGVPVITGTIDAWSEALSVGADKVGDLMVMYGTTMFLINTVEQRVSTPSMWGTVGARPRTRNLAGGMATSGAITGWLRELLGSPTYPELLAEAREAGPGAHGLLMLPYFAGERTPIMDPDARGMLAGLSLTHTRGDIYRAALEATALGVRHNIETMTAAGGHIDRLVAVGGGTQGDLWTQVVTDVTGRAQIIPSQTIGASYGAAFLAAELVGTPDIGEWNPPAHVVEPNPALRGDYDELYELYRDLYRSTQGVAHALARRQRRSGSRTE